MLFKGTMNRNKYIYILYICVNFYTKCVTRVFKYIMKVYLKKVHFFYKVSVLFEQHWKSLTILGS